MLVEARDLSFVPVRTAQPRCLTSAQIAQYNRNGFVQPFDVFPRRRSAKSALKLTS